jgi:hypothetical protein
MVTRFSRHARPPIRVQGPQFLAGGVLPVKPQAASSPGMRIFATVVLVIGVLLTIGSIFADQLNLTGGGVGLGWKQLIGVVVGLVLSLLGGAWLVQPPTSRGIDRTLE